MILSRKAKNKIVVIVGPNASGKTGLSIKLAKKMNGEIISADSRQVYKGMDIGSGKVTKKEMQGIPHYCIDVADPKKVFSALDFKNCAEKAIADILSRGKTPIMVGGTGFYIDAALGRMKLGGVPPNPKLRKKLSRFSVEKLLATLKKLDPERAKTVEQKNPVRLIRAIEISSAKKNSSLPHSQPLPLNHLSGGSDADTRLGTRSPFSNFFSDSEAKEVLRGSLAQHDGASRAIPQQRDMRANEKNYPLPKVTWIGIKRSPEDLKKRIHKRLIERLPGIIREVKKLHRNGVSWKRLFELGLEYRYASLYLRGKLNRKEFVEQLEMAIWHYAKRQMTWFKKNKEIRWIKP